MCVEARPEVLVMCLCAQAEGRFGGVVFCRCDVSKLVLSVLHSLLGMRVAEAMTRIV